MKHGIYINDFEIIAYNDFNSNVLTLSAHLLL